MNEYRKLTELEMKSYGIVVKDSIFDRMCRNVAIKYYKNPYLIERIISSEYNDSTYDNRFTRMHVYDKSGNELTPSKEQRIDCRKEISQIEYNMYQTEEPQEPSSFILVDDKIPDLYIKI